MLREKQKYRDIGRVLQKSLSSVSDEIRRNSSGGDYDPHKAHEQAKRRQCDRKRRTKLEYSAGLQQDVIEKLREDWSPEQIAGELRVQAKGKNVISHESIYLFIYSQIGKEMKLWQHLRHKKKPERTYWGSRKKRDLIPERVSIHRRLEKINDRTEFGHWEGDLVQFSTTGMTLAVFVERMSRRTVLVLNENKGKDAMEMALHELISTVGQVNFLSITFDNGLENVCHAKVRHEYAETFTSYFCDPYCSWQKGTVENTNKLLRQYFPRYISPNQLTPQFLESIAHKLNSRPRKCLNYSTPNAFFRSCSV